MEVTRPGIRVYLLSEARIPKLCLTIPQEGNEEQTELTLWLTVTRKRGEPGHGEPSPHLPAHD